MTVWFEQYLHAWGNLDLDGVTAFAADDVEFEDVGAGHKMLGKERFAKFVARSFKVLPDAKFDFLGGVETDDGYHFEWVMQPMGLRGVSVGQRRDGKVVWNRDYWNAAHFTIPEG